MAEFWANSTDVNEGEEDVSMLPLPWIAIAIVFVGVAIITGLTGNVLVLLSYRRDHRLRTVHSLYLVHMAISDVTIAGVVMPMYLIYTVTNFTWPFGPVMCKMFLVMDYTMCNMSVLTVVLVAWNQLALIRNGARYDLVETKCKAYVRLVLCWTYSFMVFSPAIILWDVVRGWSVIKDDECDVEFYADFEINVVTRILSFCLPALMLVILNTLLYLALRNRRKLARRSARSVEEDVHPWHTSPTTEDDGRPSSHPASTITSTVMTLQDQSLPPPHESHVASETSHHLRRYLEARANVRRKWREYRAGVILLFLVLMLLVTWLPYSVATIMIGACHAHCVNQDLYEVLSWILWLKSCVNPFLYALNSPVLRKNFASILSAVLPGLLRRVSPAGGLTTVTSVVGSASP